ncbi:MAG TPA: ABC transporter ATP-binding protein [Chitinophagaceae bacterium]|nr:ABC transporter ATP-binding protein [Chitinophagaceae bacterium]
MKISVEAVSKRFIHHTIFRNVNLQFNTQESYALLGANGSGKSTLLRIIAGMQTPSKGKVFYADAGKPVPQEQVFRQISFCAPGMELIEEMTLTEVLQFHFSFKSILPGLSIARVIELTGLQSAAGKQIGDFSSGMKQRVKLAQAIFSHTPVLLLDEPCTNLDQQGVQQYTEWMTQYTRERLVIVASNELREYQFCRHKIHMTDLQ